MSDYLPEEVIQGILLKLPVKSLVQCTSVCKSWNALIKSPMFISKHANRTTSSTDHQSLLLLRVCSKEGEEHYSLRFGNHDFTEYMQLHLPFKCCSSYFHVVGSCNGLICLANNFGSHAASFIIWNPLVKKYVIVKPRIHGPIYSFVGFGYDSRANDYKLIRMMNVQNMEFVHKYIPRVELYSLAEGSWRTITQIAPLRYNTDQHLSLVFVNGVAHWVASLSDQNGGFSNVVLGFDMSDEIFHEIALPGSLASAMLSSLFILEYKESSISVCQAKFQSSVQFEIWVMEEYGVAASWTRLFYTVDVQGEGIPRPLGISKEEFLMETKRGWIVSGDLKSQQVRDLRIWGEPSHTFVDSYLESLVLLDGANAASYGNNSNGLAALG